MTITDPEQERQRLAEVYGQMSEDELAQVADDDASLSEEARQALQAEIERRRLDIALNDSAAATDVAEYRELVTVHNYWDLPEALLAKARLESAGIECYLIDDNLIRIYGFISPVIGGIKLQVKPEDVDSAAQVLEQAAPENSNPENLEE